MGAYQWNNRCDIMIDIIQYLLVSHFYHSARWECNLAPCCCVGADVYSRRSQAVGGNEHSEGPNDDKEQLH